MFETLQVEPVTGFLALDGTFFGTERECAEYEARLEMAEHFRGRSELIVSYFKAGGGNPPASFPESLIKCLEKIEDDDMIDLWNQFLLHLFLDADASLFYEDRAHHVVLNEALEVRRGSVAARDPVEYFMLKAEVAFEVASFLLSEHLLSK